MLRKISLAVVLVFGLLCSLLTFASLLKAYGWLFDVLTHFHFHYALALLLCLFAATFLKPGRLFMLLFAAAFAVNAFLIAPYFWPRSQQVAGGSPLRVMSLNVFTENQNHQKISSYLRELKVDVVFLSEIEPALLTMLAQDLSDLYPHVYDESMEGTHGLAFISRHPFVKTETVMLDERHHRFLTAQLQWQGRTVTFYGAHPHPPLAPRWAQSRNDELQTIMMQVRQEANPHVLLGDLNAAPWSSVMRQLFGQTRLRHASLGFGMFPTWRYKTWLIAAPLDHILVSNEWQVRFYAPGAFVGSDHLPVLAQLHLLE